MTASRFTADPFGPDGARLFRTGDLARVLPDGRIELLGRSDRQLKLRGYRIEPGEIEQVLLEHPDIAAAAVAVRGERLVAWTVPDDRTSPAPPDRLRERLRHRLPSYMIPDLLLNLDAMPMTSAGKTDVLALTVPEDVPAREGPGSAPDADGPEGLVDFLFREVLALSEIGLDDDFFQLGGDSLRAMRLIVRLQEELGTDFDIDFVFTHPTMRETAAAIARITYGDD